MKQRIITGFIGGALFLLVIVLGGMTFTTLMTVLALIAYFEFVKMARINYLSMGSFLGFLFLMFQLLPYFISWTVSMERIIISFVFLLLLYTILSKNKFSVEQAGSLFLGTLYIGFGFSFFIETRLIHGLELILFILLLIWATDSGAYFIGRKLGKHKLWPAISPNKSVEGAVGGILSALITAMVFQAIVGLWDRWLYVLGLAFVISVIGQLGDLAESAMKRHFQVKDSGNILPGHGGVLDRFDSILFVFPILYILQLI